MALSSATPTKMRRGRRACKGLISEINMTPFVDVMLVLLIIFMVSAPLLVNGVPLELPKSQAGAVEAASQPLTVSIDETGRLAINQEYYETPALLIQKLTVLAKNDPKSADQRIFLRAAKTNQYQQILELLAMIQKAGFHNIALASLPSDGA